MPNEDSPAAVRLLDEIRLTTDAFEHQACVRHACTYLRAYNVSATDKEAEVKSVRSTLHPCSSLIHT